MKKQVYLLITAALILSAHVIGQAQGLRVEQGVSNTSTQTGGMAWIGNPASLYLSLDNNEVQARSGANAGTLFLNFFGGNVDLLGNSNTTGDLNVDGSGLFYDNSSNRVGIGTTLPGSPLHINASGGEMLRLESTAGNSYIGFRAGTTLEMWVQNSGDNMDVTNNVGGDLAIRANGDDVILDAQNEIRFLAGGSGEDAIINSVGNMGIGTLSPIDRLHVVGDARFADGNIVLTQGGEAFNIDLRTDGKVAFEANGSVGANTVVLDDDTGFVGVGLANPTEQLHVLGNLRCQGGLRLGSIEELTDGGASTIASNSDLDPTTNLIRDMGSATLAWDDINADNFINISDMRSKSNVVDMSYGLDEILQLNTIKYTLTADPDQEQKLGLSAQQLLTIVPEAVKTHDHIYDTEGNFIEVVERERMGVTYNTLIPVLINAIKELNDKVENGNLTGQDSSRSADLEDLVRLQQEQIANMQAQIADLQSKLSE
jgi:hypothetical protein